MRLRMRMSASINVLPLRLDSTRLRLDRRSIYAKTCPVSRHRQPEETTITVSSLPQSQTKNKQQQQQQRRQLELATAIFFLVCVCVFLFFFLQRVRTLWLLQAGSRRRDAEQLDGWNAWTAGSPRSGVAIS